MKVRHPFVQSWYKQLLGSQIIVQNVKIQFVFSREREKKEKKGGLGQGIARDLVSWRIKSGSMLE